MHVYAHINHNALYNISVTSNETTTNYFTSDSYYVLHVQLSDIINCNDTRIPLRL